LMDSIASLNENFVEQVLAGDQTKSTQTAQSIASQSPALKAVISETAFAALQSRLRDQEQALVRKDMTAAALASVEMYRTLQESLGPSARSAPLQLSLLDYSGFKIMAQVGAPHPNWTAIEDSVKEMSGFWHALAPKIRDKRLSGLLTSTEAGLVEANMKQDAAYTAFAAKMLLDEVDLLEAQFEK
jgi:hypothetical protein